MKRQQPKPRYLRWNSKPPPCLLWADPLVSWTNLEGHITNSIPPAKPTHDELSAHCEKSSRAVSSRNKCWKSTNLRRNGVYEWGGRNSVIKLCPFRDQPQWCCCNQDGRRTVLYAVYLFVWMLGYLFYFSYILFGLVWSGFCFCFVSVCFAVLLASRSDCYC